MQALQVTIESRSASYRNPLYSGVQKTLPCPPPSGIRGLLGAAIGSPRRVPEATRFGFAFSCEGTGTDVETYHRLDLKGPREPMAADREFLSHASLTLWVLSDIPMWELALRRPVWPLRLGRSQDLASVRSRPRVITLEEGPGEQGTSLVPMDQSRRGMRLRIPREISVDRTRTEWGDYRYDPQGSDSMIGSLHTREGYAVVPV